MKKYIFVAILILSVAGVAIFVISSRGPSNPKGPPSFFSIRFSLPQGYQFTRDAPYKLECRPNDPDALSFGRGCPKDFTPFKPPLEIPFWAAPGKTSVDLKAEIYYCDKSTEMCFRDTFQTTIPVELQDTSPATIKYVWNIWPPKRPQAADQRPQPTA